MLRPRGVTAKIILSVLITAYLAFAYLHVTAPANVTKIWFVLSGAKGPSTLNYVDWLVALGIPAVFGGIYLILRPARPPAAKFFRIHERYWLVFIFIALIILVLCAEVYEDNNKTGMAVLMGALFATAGWTFTTYMGAKNAIKAHTMNILIQMRTSTELNKHRANIQKRFGYSTKISREELSKMIAERDKPASGYENGETPVGESIRYVVNFFEFMSAGVHLEDLDEDLIRETMRSIFINFYNFSEDYIAYAVGDDYGKRNERLYRHYRALVVKFKTAPP